MLLPVSVRLGYHELSMFPARLLWVKSGLRRMKKDWACSVARETSNCSGPDKVRDLLERRADELEVIDGD